jgi:hypothetical protein
MVQGFVDFFWLVKISKIGELVCLLSFPINNNTFASVLQAIDMMAYFV